MSADEAIETPEEREGRKARELTELLAKGWTVEDLRWSVYREPSPEFLAELKASCTTKGARVLTDEERAAFADHRRRWRRGMWVIRGEAVSRRIRERAEGGGS